LSGVKKSVVWVLSVFQNKIYAKIAPCGPLSDFRQWPALFLAGLLPDLPASSHFFPPGGQDAGLVSTFYHIDVDLFVVPVLCAARMCHLCVFKGGLLLFCVHFALFLCWGDFLR
jgi:hypothetical protein